MFMHDDFSSKLGAINSDSVRCSAAFSRHTFADCVSSYTETLVFDWTELNWTQSKWLCVLIGNSRTPFKSVVLNLSCSLFSSYICNNIPVYRTHKAFETWLKKGAKGTEYILPTETLVMMNVIVDFKNQVVRTLNSLLLEQMTNANVRI